MAAPKELICATPDSCRHPQCFCEVRPHSYHPDNVYMGDCSICGQIADSDIHQEGDDDD